MTKRKSQPTVWPVEFIDKVIKVDEKGDRLLWHRIRESNQIGPSRRYETYERREFGVISGRKINDLLCLFGTADDFQLLVAFAVAGDDTVF